MNIEAGPVMTVAAFVFDRAGRLLLIKENYGQRRYGPPGGRVERDESPAQAAVREVLEETTAHVAVKRLIGMYYFAGEPWLAFAFHCELEGDSPRVPGTGEIADVGWFAPEDLPKPQTALLRHALGDVMSRGYGHVRDYPAR